MEEHRTQAVTLILDPGYVAVFFKDKIQYIIIVMEIRLFLVRHEYFFGDDVEQRNNILMLIRLHYEALKS